MTVTIFVSTFNRTDTLIRTLQSYLRFTTPYEVVIVDNGSTWDAARDLLDRLEESGGNYQVTAVKRYPLCGDLTAVARNIHRAVRWRYRAKHRTAWYAVTDADICFEGSSPDTLAAYIEFFKRTDDAPGPHTRVHDGIPKGYPLRSRVLATESRPTYRSRQNELNVGSKMPIVRWSWWSIDTTFHLFPRTDGFAWRLMDTARLGPPYDALHLDWYMDIFNPSPEADVYVGNQISSWGASWMSGFWREFRDGGHAFSLALDEGERQNRLIDSDTGLLYEDLNNGFFLASWCAQYGVGGAPKDIAMSKRLLQAAIPQGTPYREHVEDWYAMIYDSDFTCLGWT